MNLLKISMALGKTIGSRIQYQKLCNSLKTVKSSIHRGVSVFMNNPG